MKASFYSIFRITLTKKRHEANSEKFAKKHRNVIIKKKKFLGYLQMKNKKSAFLSILFLIPISLFSVGQLDGLFASKKPLLGNLKGKVEQGRPEKQPAQQQKSLKKGGKKGSFLTRAIDYIKDKKGSFLKKIRLFYRRHFYLSLFGGGLLCSIAAYYLSIHGLPLLQDLIQKYRQNRAIISQRAPTSLCITQNDTKPLPERVNQSEVSNGSTLGNESPSLESDVVNQSQPKEIIVPAVDQGDKELEKGNTLDNPVNEINRVDQKVEAPAVISVEAVALPFKKISSPEEIRMSKKIYNNSVDFVNNKLLEDINHLNDLKNQYEVAKKKFESSPHDVKLYNDHVKTEKVFIKTKNDLMTEVKHVVQTVDADHCVKNLGFVKELDKKELEKSQRMIPKWLDSDSAELMISNSRKQNVNDAFVYEKFYGAGADGTFLENIPGFVRDEVSFQQFLKNDKARIAYFSKNAAEAQKTQHEGFSYVSTILKSVLLPFVESL
jgi:hypothetical protein